MDVKALAKSKRGHTQQHNKRYHPHGNKLKAPSPSSSSSPSSPASEPLTEKKTHRSRPALPTNWDRYEEEELDSVSAEGASKTLDVVVPKSKGADFRHLLAEAHSKTLECSPSLDDLLPWELGVGLSSMLEVKGEGIVSWVGDDNFVVQDDDKTSANQEVIYFGRCNETHYHHHHHHHLTLFTHI